MRLFFLKQYLHYPHFVPILDLSMVKHYLQFLS